MRKNDTQQEVEDEEVVKSDSDKVADAVREEKNTMPYVSASTCPAMGVVVPTKLAYETVESLNKFILNGIDTATIVQDKLKYNSRLSVCDAFTNEQCDAIALAIEQIEKGKGFILGDMAGIGKGRVCAGILRYAKVNGMTPVFVTCKVALFSAMWGDFIDIKGIDNYGNQPTPFIFNEDGEIIKDINGKSTVVYPAQKSAITIEFCRRKKMPINNDLVMTTYSQLGNNLEVSKNANCIAKCEFLKSISDNAIFVLDESHAAAGDSFVGKNMANILSNSKGVMYSSATYAKAPKSMLLYIPKTDIRDSNINPKTIINAVNENGEAVQEYIASQIVKSGQMIRRQRSYEGCKITYNYMDASLKPKYYALYDNVMELYNEIEEFAKGSILNGASGLAILRYAENSKITLVDPNDRKPTKEADKSAWEERNKDKYTYSFGNKKTVSNRFQWIENLLFSIKATYVAEKTVELLQTREMVDYLVGDVKSKVNTNFKPIIAVRSTAEASLNTLGYKVGAVISPEDNDYAKTLINVVKSLLTSTMEFTPVNPKHKTVIFEDASILMSEFSDGGEKYTKLLNDISSAVSGLPISPIDHMITKIENSVRKEWDYEFVGSEQKNFIVDEITMRQISIKPTTDENGMPILIKDKNGIPIPDKYVAFDVKKIKKESNALKVNRFNAGQSDVLIINTSGSTGLSIHSKHDFADRRPRVMLIHQVELDVSTETQKRGRIHRTGQVNKPAYTYIVSVVPSEVRKLLMLRKKMRSLDANTSGDVTQSAEASKILDQEGFEIQDMCNKYGYEILLQFKELPNRELFKDIVSESFWEGKKTSPEEKFSKYLLEVEKLSCENQETFYNEMNAAYSKLKAEKDEDGSWDLETSIENLNASTYNKKLLYYGNDKNEFTKSVYIEDKFITPKVKPYTKDEVLDKIVVLCKGKTPDEFHTKLLDDFREYKKKVIADVIIHYGEPKIENEDDPEKIEEIKREHAAMVELAIKSNNEKLNSLQLILEFFKPKKYVQVPIAIDDLQDGYEDDKGQRKTSVDSAAGYFVGYKINEAASNKFSPMNIQLEFASTSRIRPHLKISLTKQYENIYRWIMGGEVVEFEARFIREWSVQKTGEREFMRVLTGELFKAFEITDDLFNKDLNYVTGKRRLIKYTTASGSIETGVRIYEKKHISLTVGKTPTFAPINSDAYISIIDETSLFAENSGNDIAIFLPSLKDMIYVHSDGGFTFGVCTGKKGSSDKCWKAYLSDWATTKFQNQFKESTNLTLNKTRFDLRMETSGNSKNEINVEFLAFHFNRTKLKDVLDFLFKEYKVLMPLKSADGDFLITEMEDMGAKPKTEEDKEKEGVFDYYPLLPFDASNPPPDYIPNSYRTTPDNKEGIISLKFPMRLLNSALYKMLPVNITEKEAVLSIMQQIGEDKKLIDYIRDVKELKDDYFAIFILTQKTIGFNPIYAIGNVDEFEGGEIIARNIDLKPESKSDDTPSKKVEPKPKKQREGIPLNWESLQDFLIQMKSL